MRPQTEISALARVRRQLRRVARTSRPVAIFRVLLRDSGHDRISVLKLDIEGAETVLFTSGYEDWIDTVDTFVIELHEDSPWGNASAAFHVAIEGRGLALSRSAEVTIARRFAV